MNGGAVLAFSRRGSSASPRFAVFRVAKGGNAVGTLLIVNSLLTLACACWLALMELILRNPGYGTRTAVAFGITLICLATIVARLLHANVRLERWLWPGAVILVWIGTQAFVDVVRAPRFEGFAFLISIVVVLQGALMFTTLGWPHPTQSTRQVN